MWPFNIYMKDVNMKIHIKCARISTENHVIHNDISLSPIELYNDYYKCYLLYYFSRNQ